MANEFLAGRVAIGASAISGNLGAQTVNYGINIPGGVLITGVTYMDDEALTVAGDATYQPAIINTVLSSTQYFVSTENVSDFPAQTIASAPALLTAGGVYIAQAGELGVVLNSSAEALTWSPSVYIGYVDIA